MSSQRYSPEFKDEAVRQIVDRGYSVTEVAEKFLRGTIDTKNGGERGIRTLERLLTFTRFPGEPIQPLWHLSDNFPPIRKAGYCMQ